MGRVTTSKVIGELRRLRKLISKKYKIKQLILFGSRARGDELLSSDVDIIVVSPDFSGVPFRKRPDSILDAWKLPVDLEVLCYSPEELKRKQREIGIVQEALKQGKTI